MQNQEPIYHATFDHAAQPMLLVSAADGTVIDANQAACRCTAHSRERLRAMHLSDLQPLPQERRYQATLRNGNGAHLPLEATLTPLPHQLPTALLLTDLAPQPDHHAPDPAPSSTDPPPPTGEPPDPLQTFAQRMQAARELSRLRDDFVSSITHELRTPLTTIIGFAQLLEAHWPDLDDEKRIRHLHRISIAASRQKRLVDDLLELSRLDLGSLAHTPIATTLNPIIAGSRRVVAAAYPNQRFAIPPTPDITIYADPDRVAQILVHLLDNAAKHSPPHQPVHVTTRVETATAFIEVRDHGCGIPEQERDRLFTRFGLLADSPIRAGHVGTGIGLHLSRNLALAMQGNLELAHSDADGSLFILHLPLASSQP